MINLRKYKLAEVILKANTGLDAIKRAPIVNYNSGIKCLRIQDISQEKEFNNWGFCEVSSDNYSKFQLKTNDIIVARTGNTIGVNNFIAEDLKSVFNNGLIRLKVDESIAIPKFVYYTMQTSAYWSHIDSIAFGTSTQPNMQIESFLNYEITLPNIVEQQCVVSVLDSINDKIALNRRMNQTLGQMTATLFKKYFVDDIDLDNLPEGWKIKTIGDIAEVIDCLHSKKPEKHEVQTGNVLLQLDNILNNGLLDVNSAYYISEVDYKKWISRIEVKFGDCVITNVGRSGVSARVPKGVMAAMGRNMTAIRLKKEFNYPAFLITLLTSSYMKKVIESNLDVGTILDALNVRSIPLLKFPFPSELTLIELVESQLAPLWLMMENNLKEINQLAQTRDLLLPKLMSGKLDVAKINQNELLHEPVLS